MKEKTFDAVKMMRDIRYKISTETQNMTFAELQKYIASRIKNSGLQVVDKVAEGKQGTSNGATSTSTDTQSNHEAFTNGTFAGE